MILEIWISICRIWQNQHFGNKINRTVDLLVSLIHPNSITPLMPNPFQIDSDMQIHIPKTKIPISSKTSIKLTISNHHNFRIKQFKILLTTTLFDRLVCRTLMFECFTIIEIDANLGHSINLLEASAALI